MYRKESSSGIQVTQKHKHTGHLLRNRPAASSQPAGSPVSIKRRPFPFCKEGKERVPPFSTFTFVSTSGHTPVPPF